MVSRLFPRNPSIHHRTTIPPPGLASRIGAYREITGRPMDNHAWLGRHAFRESGACASLAVPRLVDPAPTRSGVIRYLRDHEFRHVRLNEPHPAHVAPSWNGDSVGHYEGDTLVIDTVGVKTDRPLAMLDMYGTPYTRALHVVERYRLLDYEAAREGVERDAKESLVIPNTSMQRDPAYRGKYLQLLFTVVDQGVFTMPWSATITYGRPSDGWKMSAPKA